jgi:hypothetical protein
MVGGAFMAIAALLEGLQALTPDRSAYLPAVFYGATAALVAEVVIRVWRLCAGVGESYNTPSSTGARLLTLFREAFIGFLKGDFRKLQGSRVFCHGKKVVAVQGIGLSLPK